jgi:hypothetical protein
VKGKEVRIRNEEGARGTQVPSGGRQAIGGNIIKIEERRPHTGVQIIHFMLENTEKPRICTN